MLNPHSRIITRDRGLLGAQLRRNAARFYRLGSEREASSNALFKRWETTWIRSTRTRSCF
jgi:hypothetical protein